MEDWGSLLTGVGTGVATALITILFTFKQKIFEARLDIKKQAFLEALNILDAQASFYFKAEGAILQKVAMEKIRATFNNLLVFSNCLDIPRTYVLFICGKNDNKMKTLNTFRNLIRKELGLGEVDFKDVTYKNIAYFNSVECANEAKVKTGNKNTFVPE